MRPLKYVFVYGTLKQGYQNHYILADQIFVGKAITEPAYRLFDCGFYPCLVEKDKGYSVEGEVYAVDSHTMSRLDRLEGYPHLYDRKQIKIKKVDWQKDLRITPSDSPFIQAYFYQDGVSDFKEITSGIWEGSSLCEVDI